MAKEIERKFLIKDSSWLDDVKEKNISGIKIRQAYLSDTNWGVVRVRQAGEKAYLTIKTRSETISRDEFEYEIPLADAEQIFNSLDSTCFIEKTRYKIPHKEHIWDLDVFEGANAGLIVAEIELSSIEEKFALPQWAGEEVSKISKYFNSRLAKSPISRK